MESKRTTILLAILARGFAFAPFFGALLFAVDPGATLPVAGRQTATYIICKRPTGRRSVNKEERGSATMEEKSRR